MNRLNQIIAVEKGIKSRVYSEISELHKVIQKPDLFNGFAKQYQKKDEDGEDFPAERKRVQFNTKDVLRNVERATTEYLNVMARKDWTNCEATSDVVLDDTIVLEDVPVTYLLAVEKQLVDLRTFVGALPELDETEDWIVDENTGLFKTEPSQTHRTKKVPKPIVMYPATPEHPAQTQLTAEDVIVGFWHTVKHSGAIPKPVKQKILERIEKVVVAVKTAREAANSTEEVATPNVGAAIFGYILK